MGGRIHTQEGWPRFRWNRESLSERLASVRHEQGRLLARMEALGFKLRQEREFHERLEYMQLNPVRKGLVKRPEDWRPIQIDYVRLPPGYRA